MQDTKVSPLQAEFLVMKARHRELDEQISFLQSNTYSDQLMLRRLKKQKLQLKDTIEKLRAKLIPDLDA